jgi:hypothetical protein
MLRHKRTKARLGHSEQATESLKPATELSKPAESLNSCTDTKKSEQNANSQPSRHSEHSKDTERSRLAKIVEQRTWENGQLRQELAREKRKSQAGKHLQEEVGRVTESLQQALINFQMFNTEFGDESPDCSPPIPARRR